MTYRVLDKVRDVDLLVSEGTCLPVYSRRTIGFLEAYSPYSLTRELSTNSRLNYSRRIELSVILSSVFEGFDRDVGRVNNTSELYREERNKVGLILDLFQILYSKRDNPSLKDLVDFKYALGYGLRNLHLDDNLPFITPGRFLDESFSQLDKINDVLRTFLRTESPLCIYGPSLINPNPSFVPFFIFPSGVTEEMYEKLRSEEHRDVLRRNNSLKYSIIPAKFMNAFLASVEHPVFMRRYGWLGLKMKIPKMSLGRSNHIKLAKVGRYLCRLRNDLATLSGKTYDGNIALLVGKVNSVKSIAKSFYADINNKKLPKYDQEENFPSLERLRIDLITANNVAEELLIEYIDTLNSRGCFTFPFR